MGLMHWKLAQSFQFWAFMAQTVAAVQEMREESQDEPLSARMSPTKALGPPRPPEGDLPRTAPQEGVSPSPPSGGPTPFVTPSPPPRYGLTGMPVPSQALAASPPVALQGSGAAIGDKPSAIKTVFGDRAYES